jgi:DNA mismatch repair protein MutL
VKELVENSIDAGARKIDIFVRRGGVSYIRVIDDGCGMDRDDALLSLERHATSKIRSVADLEAVGTLGFRGEALPSIASVSRFRLTSREPNAVAGTEIIVNGGKIDVVRDGGEAPGTQVEVRSLFYNLPARRKFLRSENTESRNIEHQLHLQAIGHPQIAFTFARDDRLVFQLPATTTLADRIRDLYGNQLLDQLLPINESDSAQIRIAGLIGRAGLSRQTRSQQLVFVNGRAIESPLITAAMREGYHTALMKGQYPVTFLFLELDPGAVDVNVHPAKREVRFRDPNAIREAIARSIQETLAIGRADWQEKFRAPIGIATPSDEPRGGSPPCELPELEREFALRGQRSVEVSPIGGATSVSSQTSASPDEFVGRDRGPSRTGVGPSTPQQFQIIGVLNKLYVLMENADGLVLVDQHAAHERILFEELRRRMEEQGVPSQKLLISQTFELPPRDADWIEQNMSILQKMGIGIENFGPNTFKIDSLPGFLKVTDGAQFMRKVIDDLKSASDRSSPLRLGEDMIASTVCRHAVKANDPLRYLEVEKLIQDLLDCELPYCCPHGRPTMIQISNAELEKKFGRKV